MSESRVHVDLETGNQSFSLTNQAQECVEWMIWSEDAFARAQRENKPVFVCLGFIGCQEYQSLSEEVFADANLASMLSQSFICVKVDRDELPDVEDLLLRAHDVLIGGATAGTLLVMLTSQGIPYFSASSCFKMGTWNIDEFAVLCSTSLRIFFSEKERLDERTARVVESLNKSDNDSSLRALEQKFSDENLNYEKILNYLKPSILKMEDTIESLLIKDLNRSVDLSKFPQLSHVQALLFSGQRKKIAAALMTLDKLRCGGFVDLIEGGVCRYEWDSQGQLKYVRKSLVDQLQLAVLFAQGSAFLKKANPQKASEFIEASRDLFSYIDNNLKNKDDELYCFSEFLNTSHCDQEPSHFFSFSEFKEVFAAHPQLLDFALSFFGITKNGNLRGTNVLQRPVSLDEFCKDRNYNLQEAEEWMQKCLLLLRQARASRQFFSRNEHLILFANSLCADAFLCSAQILGDENLFRRGFDLLEKIWSFFVTENGEVLRFLTKNHVSEKAYLDDLAYLLKANTEAYFASGIKKHALRAQQVVKWIHKSFVDPSKGTLFYSRQSAHVCVRSLKLVDADLPSPAGVVYGSCRTFLVACAATGAIAQMETGDIKMWEAAALVALASFAGSAMKDPQCCASGLLSVRWSCSQNVCSPGSNFTSQSQTWLMLSQRFWDECMAVAGVWCVLSRGMAPDDVSDLKFVAAERVSSDTGVDSFALVLNTVQGVSRATVNYSDMIEKMRILPWNGG